MADEYLTTEQLAKLLGVSVTTIKRMRSANEGPRATRWGRLVRYRTTDVEAWLRQIKKDDRP